VIVPVLAQEILKRNEDNGRIKINFKGYSLCNPAVDVEIENNAFVPYAFRMGLISDELYQNLVSTCNGKYWNNKGPSCLANLEQFHKVNKICNATYISRFVLLLPRKLPLMCSKSVALTWNIFFVHHVVIKWE
jgi:serine carboxypeptidase-like clade 1